MKAVRNKKRIARTKKATERHQVHVERDPLVVILNPRPKQASSSTDLYFIWKKPSGPSLVGFIVHAPAIDNAPLIYACERTPKPLPFGIRVELNGMLTKEEHSGATKRQEFIPSTIHVSFGEFSPIFPGLWKARKIEKTEWIWKLIRKVSERITAPTRSLLDPWFQDSECDEVERRLRHNIGPLLDDTELLYLTIHAMWDHWNSTGLKYGMRFASLRTLGFAYQAEHLESKGAFSTTASRAGLPKRTPKQVG